jgi:hypothetical protein
LAVTETLALGNRSSEAAKRFRVTEGRISQLRRELAGSWGAFVGDLPLSRGVAVATA